MRTPFFACWGASQLPSHPWCERKTSPFLPRPSEILPLQITSSLGRSRWVRAGRLGEPCGVLGVSRRWGPSNNKCGRISTSGCCCWVENWSKPFQALPWSCFGGRTGWAAAQDQRRLQKKVKFTGNVHEVLQVKDSCCSGVCVDLQHMRRNFFAPVVTINEK